MIQEAVECVRCCPEHAMTLGEFAAGMGIALGVVVVLVVVICTLMPLGVWWFDKVEEWLR